MAAWWSPAAKRGARGFGVDINPQRIKEANANAEAAGVTDKVEFKIANLFEQDLSKADVMAMYLLTDINLRLRPKILDTMKPGTRIVSHAFDMGDWKPEVHENVNGRNVYFWIVPAKVNGTWNVQGENKMKVSFDQKYQFFTGKADMGGKTFDITDGRIKGAEISFKMGGQYLYRQGRRQHHHRREMEGHQGLRLPPLRTEPARMGKTPLQGRLSFRPLRAGQTHDSGQISRRAARDAFR